jgi:hypothetical protein
MLRGERLPCAVERARGKSNGLLLGDVGSMQAKQVR